MFQHGGSFIQEMLKQHLHLPGSGDTITTTHSAPKILSSDAKTAHRPWELLRAQIPGVPFTLHCIPSSNKSLDREKERKKTQTRCEFEDLSKTSCWWWSENFPLVGTLISTVFAKAYWALTIRLAPHPFSSCIISFNPLRIGETNSSPFYLGKRKYNLREGGFRAHQSHKCQ